MFIVISWNSSFHFFTKQQNLGLSKLKALTDDKINVTEKFSFWVWKHCGKERKCWLPAFSPFHTIFSSTGHRPASLCHDLLSVLRPCVRSCVNFFFKHLLLWNYWSDFDEISQKCSCHGPLQNFVKKFDSVKNCGCHGNKTEKILKTWKIFLSESIRVKATKFGM